MALNTQLQSRLIQAPFDVRNAILSYVCPGAIHLHLQGDQLIALECVSSEAIHEEHTGYERREGLPVNGGDWNFEDTYVWAQRLMSTWGPHWKCRGLSMVRFSTLSSLLHVCKMMKHELSDMLMRSTVFNVTDFRTANYLLNNSAEAIILGHAPLEIRKLDLVLRLPVEVFTATELRETPEIQHHDPWGNVIHPDHEEAKMWLRVCAELPHLPKLSELRLWLDHDGRRKWALVSERAFLSPLVSSMAEAKAKVIVHLPFVNPGMEDAGRHYLESNIALRIEVVRRIRQRHHGYVIRKKRLLVDQELDFPMLEVGDYPFEEMKLQELRAVERELWKNGIDVEHDIVNDGIPGCSGGFCYEDYVELKIAEREKELGRSLRWPGQS